ncbi:MAG: ATP-binding protein [Thermotaleaceae bacterium]
MISPKSLNIRIPALIIVLVMITITGTSYMSYKVFSNDIKDQILNKNLIITDMISEQVSLYLSAAQDTVEYVAKYATHNDLEMIQRSIDKIFDTYSWMDLMFYMSPQGRIVYSNPHNDIIYHRDYVDREYYQYMLQNKKSYISKVFISSILNLPHIIIVAPILDDNTGELKGIIGGGVPLTKIKEIVEKTQGSFEGSIYVVDIDGTILVSPNQDNTNQGMPLTRDLVVNGRSTDIHQVLQKYEQGTGEYMENTDNIYVSFKRIPNYRGMVIIEQHEKYIVGQIGTLKSRFFSGVLFVMIAVLILSMYFAYTITSPIKKLVDYVRLLSSDLDKGTHEVQVTNKDEIGELETAFHNMSKELRVKMEALRKLHKREYEIKKYLNNILKSAASGIIVVDIENKISIFNTAAEEITGYQSRFFINKDLDLLSNCTGLPQEIFKYYITGEGNAVEERECSIKKNDGSLVPISISLSPVYNDEGRVISTVCLIKDLTKLKVLEGHLRREDRLKTIGELSSSIIHEIGNPLAGMTNLLEVLKDNLEEKELREELLLALEEEVNMLNNIVINFLDYTRTHKNKPVSTNILGVINSALNLLNSEIANKSILVEKKFPNRVPLVRIDPSTVRQAFVNIFKNSIQALNENGRIIVEVKNMVEDGKKILGIFILDTGQGIPAEKIDQIFNPFYTTKEDGTGLGLSIVHKIIRENNGTITVRSEAGKHTEFIICFEGEILDETINY